MKTTTHDLKNHLFDVIERLKCSGDPDVDPKDTISAENAKAITDCAKVIVEVSKTEIQALMILAKAENPDRTQRAIIHSGLLKDAE